MEDRVRLLLMKVLRELEPEVIPDSVEIMFYQRTKERHDCFGRYRTPSGLYEFAISFDDKGKIKRNHINLISTKTFFDDIERKMKQG
jgi:hypothetical protein